MNHSNATKDRIVTMQKTKAATNRQANPGEDRTKRLTIDVGEPLHKALKMKAATDGVTMTEIVRQLLTQQISRYDS